MKNSRRASKRRPQPPSAKDLYADPRPSGPRRQATYLPQQKPCAEEPDALPRLFIRGGIGGSIKCDLLGLGVRLSQAAFVQWIADESLSDLDLHRGDLVVVDPGRPTLETGDLVLLGGAASGAVRRLSLRQRAWHLETAGGAPPESVPYVDQPLEGVVVGAVRLFTRIKAVAYRGTEANFAPSFERREPAGPSRRLSRRAAAGKPAMTAGTAARYAPRGKKPFLLAAEDEESNRYSEVAKNPPYKSRAKSR